MPIEKLISLNFPPGLLRNGTQYQSKGRWRDANLVRWYEGIMGPIGGWRTIRDISTGASLQVTGKTRGVHGWRDNSEVSWLAIGTHTHLYSYTDGVLADITPTDMASFAMVDGKYLGGGYGKGYYGKNYYGTGTGGLTLYNADTWQQDNFGEIWVGTLTADGRIFSWTPGDPKAVPLADAGSGAPPTNCTGVVVTPELFLVALGANGDARLVQWASQETTTIWTPNIDTNTAGDFELPTKGRLVCGRRSRRQTMLWTDVDLYAMTFVGGSAIYAFEQLGDNCGIVGPNAPVVLGDRMFWMSHAQFFTYDGALKPLACDVLDHVFNKDEVTSLHALHRAKTYAIANTLYNEIVWFYVSKRLLNGTEPDSYVMYNFAENHWTVGTLNRNGGIDRGVFEYPIWIGSDGFLYEHEFGDDRTGAGVVFAESGPMEIGDGDNLARIQTFIPDEKTQGDVSTSLYVSKWPNGPEALHGPFTAANPTSMRVLGRQARLRIDEVRASRWRVGVPRLGVLPGGRR